MSIPRLIAWLAVICLSSSWAAIILSMSFGRMVAESSGIGLRYLPYESSVVSILRLLAIASALGSGLLAALRGGFKAVSLSGRAGYLLALITSLVWITLTYGVKDLRDVILGPTSPIIWILLIAVFAGALPTTWSVLDPAIKLLHCFTIPFVVWFIVRSRGYWRCEGLNPVTESAILLIWLGAYLWLVSPPVRFFSQGLRLIGTALAFGAALCSQSRGWLLQLVLLGVCVTAGNLRFRKRESQRGLLSGVRMVSIAVAACAAAVWILQTVEPAVLDKLVSRLTEDTRSEQYHQFFAQVDPSDLLVGKGPHASYRFESNSAYQYFDNGFIWMLFLAGLPMVVAYCLLIVLPGVALLMKARDSQSFGIGALLLMWTFALAGVSTFNAINGTMHACFIMFVAGLCHTRLTSESVARQTESAEQFLWGKTFNTSV